MTAGDVNLQRLIAAHPALFRGQPPALGGHVSTGWYDLIDQLCSDIEAALGPEATATCSVEQIKEKFGELRFYASSDGRNDVRQLINAAREESTSICTTCGAPGEIRAVSGRYTTLCEAHLAKEAGVRAVAPESAMRMGTSSATDDEKRSAPFTRVISIDVDGVCHPSPRCIPKREDVAPMQWLDFLAQLLVGHPDVGILVHSSWRETYTEHEIRDLLHPLEAHFVGVAPAGPRAEAVQQWLNAHPGVPLLAVDDEPDEFIGLHGYLFIACDPRHGLSSETVQSSIKGWLQRTASWPPPRMRGDALDVLYLDFDAVLHPEAVWWNFKRGAYLDKELVAQGHRLFEHCDLLERMLRSYPEVRIVLSTSWVKTYSFSAAAKRLSKALRDRCIGATYHSQMHRNSFDRMPRGLQVLADVTRRRPLRWLALDDVDEGWGSHRNDVVLTHVVHGIAHPPVLEELRTKLMRFW